MRRWLVSLLVLVMLGLVALVGRDVVKGFDPVIQRFVKVASPNPNIPKRLQVDPAQQNFEDNATPTSYVACRGCVGIHWYVKHPNHHKQDFGGGGSTMAARGSVCPSGAQGWIFTQTFRSWSLVGGGLRHVLAAANIEILWCTKNGKVVRGSTRAIPTNHCGKGTVDTVFDYGSCSIDRGTLYLSSLHVWELWHYSYDLKLKTIHQTPQLDFHVHSDGRINGVYDPG